MAAIEMSVAVPLGAILLASSIVSPKMLLIRFHCFRRVDGAVPGDRFGGGFGRPLGPGLDRLNGGRRRLVGRR
jgi:hypothetical protein